MYGNTPPSITESALEDETSASIPAEEIHRVFSEPVRRAVLAVLADESTPTSLETLAYGLESGSNEDGSCVEAYSVALHHRHLPILDEVGLVDYEPSTNTIRSCHGSLQSLVD